MTFRIPSNKKLISPTSKHSSIAMYMHFVNNSVLFSFPKKISFIFNMFNINCKINPLRTFLTLSFLSLTFIGIPSKILLYP